MDLELNQSIITKFNVDNNENPISVTTIEEQQIHTLKNLIQTCGIIDEFNRVKILDRNMYEVNSVNEITAINQYYVDYANGIMHFHPDIAGSTIRYQYGNLGIDYISANRIFTNQDDGGNIVELLQEIIDLGREAVDAMKTIGGVVIIMKRLEDDIVRGQQLHEDLQNDMKVTGNNIIYITSSQWVYSPTSEMYEYTITHTLNSASLIIDFYATDTNDFLNLGGKIVDNTHVLVRSDEAINVKCIINARYFKGNIEVNDSTVEEVFNARKGEVDLKTKIDKMDENILTLQLDTKDFITSTKSSISAINSNLSSANTSISENTNRITEIEKSIKESRKFIINIGDVVTVAHRGLSGVYTENTMLAYKGAKRVGFDIVETDVQFTSDGVPVLFHDETLDSKTNSTGKIIDKTYSQVQSIYYTDPLYPNLKLTLFEDFVKWCKANNIRSFIELTPIQNWDKSHVQKVLDIIYKYDYQESCLLTCFYYDKLNYVREIDSEIELGINCLNGITTDDINKAIEYKYCHVSTEQSYLSKSIVDNAHMNNIAVCTWTINNYVDMDKVKSYGVNGFVSNEIIKREV